jgi:hypothetical protein
MRLELGVVELLDSVLKIVIAQKLNYSTSFAIHVGERNVS